MEETLFNPQAVKLFLRRTDAPEAEPWQELTAGVCQLGPFEESETPTGHAFTSTLRCTLTLRPLGRKTFVRLMQTAGVMRRPRCTYKTNKDYINRRRYNGRRKPRR